jgi:hypothetical protein
MNAMFFEVGRDERQLVNGVSEFPGHASRSNGHEANSGDGGRNLQRANGANRISEIAMTGKRRKSTSFVATSAASNDLVEVRVILSV